MKTSLKKPGKRISLSEVTNIGQTGFWLLVDNAEYFVPFDDYPAFRKATAKQIFSLKRLGPKQFYWPELDIDIELNALKHPEYYPLHYK